MAVAHIFRGAMAGLAATAPMTAAMRHMYRRLPQEEQYPLPPAEIADSILQHLGIKPALTAPQEKTLILLGHYGYGALSGAVYAALTPKGVRLPLARGAGFGVLLWAASYLGWLPLLHILTPATQHPRGRTLLMLTAHAFWGGMTGVLCARELT